MDFVLLVMTGLLLLASKTLLFPTDYGVKQGMFTVSYKSTAPQSSSALQFINVKHVTSFHRTFLKIRYLRSLKLSLTNAICKESIRQKRRKDVLDVSPSSED